MAKTALLAGASGLVGGHCLRLLLEDPAYDKVRVVARRRLAFDHPKLEQHVLDFSRLKGTPLTKVDEVFCCLGTTIAKAGSQDAFRKVDFFYPLELAISAAANKARTFLLVSAAGADPRSRIFYNRVKGQLEEAVSLLPFSSIHILRPSLLLGERKEVRLKEKLAAPVLKAAAFLLVGPWRKYRAIEASCVAAALVRAAREGPQGVNVWESDRIAELGAQR